MRRMRFAMSALAVLSSTVVAQERREMGAHVHGAGKLSIAIEGNQVAIELSAPAMDILGFERQPATPDELKTLETAKEALAELSKIIELPAAADCKAEKGNVVFNAPAQPASSSDNSKPTPSPSGQQATSDHADFDVDYALICAAPDKLTMLNLPYFKQFPGAQTISVTVVGEQSGGFELTRDKPSQLLK